ncbi:unnamed protein product [Orchesella dallaii]|uniref:Uncharacterized protein n=1 Tax=Orchesella dallaii TaxID=48710 RepID=A0ABP1PKA3_9HEXA
MEKDFTAHHSVKGVDPRPDRGIEDDAALKPAEAHEIRDEVVSYLSLPLKTPDKRLLSSENISHGVRKRSLPSIPTPTPDCDSDDEIPKHRQVSKALFASTSISEPEAVPDRSNVSRNLFGPPSEEALALTRRKFEEKINLEFEEFCQGYEIVSVIHSSGWETAET